MIEDIYRLNEEQENNLWKDAVFVIVTAVLIYLYQYFDSAISDIFTTSFDVLKVRILIPFNVTLEYIGNLHKAMNKLKNEYRVLESNFKNIENHREQITIKT